MTHHVEEIMSGFTHALVLRAGRVFATGPVRRVITPRILSGAFGAPLKVRLRRGRYQLDRS